MHANCKHAKTCLSFLFGTGKKIRTELSQVEIDVTQVCSPAGSDPRGLWKAMTMICGGKPSATMVTSNAASEVFGRVKSCLSIGPPSRFQ